VEEISGLAIRVYLSKVDVWENSYLRSFLETGFSD
jgi:hypothetical protein